MTPRKDAKTNAMHVLFNRNPGNVIGVFPQSRVNYVSSCVAKRQRNHLGANIMSVQAWFYDEDAFAFECHEFGPHFECLEAYRLLEFTPVAL